MTDYTRRRLLAAGGAVTVAGIAGCSRVENTAESEPTPNEPTESDQPEPPLLESISLENLNDQSHTLDIIIQRNDEIVYWTTHELSAISEPTSSIALDSELPTEPGAFQLVVRLDDDTRAQFSSTELPERDCIDLVVMITREGGLSILTNVSGGRCSADSSGNTTAEQ